MVKRILVSKSLDDIENHVYKLATELGVGDDVSLSLLINKKTKVKFYQ